MGDVTLGTTVNESNGACSVVDTVVESRLRPVTALRRISRKVSIANVFDTYSTGLTNIVRLAWEPDTNVDYAAAYFASTADKRIGKITFATSNSLTTGTLHIWVG